MTPRLPAQVVMMALASAATAQDGGDAPVPLPSDEILHPLWERQGVSLTARQEFDRTLLRPGLAWQDSLGGIDLELLDTASIVANSSPRRLDADFGTHLALTRAMGGGSGTFSWQQTGQMEGQGAQDASTGGHRTRGKSLIGWSTPWNGWRWGGWGGLLWERIDPAWGTLGLSPGESARPMSLATAIGALEAGYHGEGILEKDASVQIQRDLGDRELREESGNLRVDLRLADPISSSLSGAIDAIRRRSEVLGTDRDIVHRSLASSWGFPSLNDQSLRLEIGWADTLALDYTGRVPGDDAAGVGGQLTLDGVLPAGFFHMHGLSMGAGRHDVLDLEGVQGALERNQSSRASLLRLADSLGWEGTELGGIQVKAGGYRSLATLRHPANPTPASSDRPDQDFSETGLGILVRDSLLGREQRPLFAWSWFRRDEVYLRSVHSAETRRREGHRISGDIGLLPAERILLEAGTSAREQRSTWRFDTTRNEGLMEWQWDAALQEGPRLRPNFRLWIEQRLSWNGGLVGEDFAVERRTVVWKPGARLWWWWKPGIGLSPWVERWWENRVVWDGSQLASEPRVSEWRVALDGQIEGEHGQAQVSVVRVASDPGSDDWRITAEGRWSW
ncbi:MAG: hypothetical protein H6686_00485 [Fibrobacteria bacterium]|nr:hypothetical protein [Fibrobacteria bacterium]